MLRQRLVLFVPAAYVWIAMVAFGGIAVETIVIYPNVFHDVPQSLARSVDFFIATGPADFFPPMGAATIAAGLTTLLVVWRIHQARWWLCASLVSLVVGEFLFSVLYFWPRNTIMFDEGIAIHSADFLRRTAAEFESGHWLRLAMSAVTATLGFIAFLRYYRNRRTT